MRITLVHNAQFPVEGYGGTERVFWWLAKGLRAKGHTVQVAARPGSRVPFASQIVDIDFSKPVSPQLPSAEITHFFFPPDAIPSFPHLVTIHGNGQPNETFLPNSVFVSANHAKRHHATAFVHNGIDPDDYTFSANKSSHLVFCAKASWRVKNVRGAIRIAEASGHSLKVIGGTRPWWSLPSARVQWQGVVGGAEKNACLASAKGLLFPVRWHEPFGIAVIEALVSGTPVLVTPFGSLPELISPDVGKLCSSYAEFVDGVANLSSWKAQACRDWAVSNFHFMKMTEAYLKFYEQVVSGKTIHAEAPRATPSAASPLLPIPLRTG